MPGCLNCGHAEDRHDPYGCYTNPDGTRAPELKGYTCLCGFWSPPVEPDPDPVEDPEPEPGADPPAEEPTPGEVDGDA